LLPPIGASTRLNGSSSCTGWRRTRFPAAGIDARVDRQLVVVDGGAAGHLVITRARRARWDGGAGAAEADVPDETVCAP
jgi:hypothetical protein